MLKPRLALALAAFVTLFPATTLAAECAVDGVRVALADDGDSATLEIVARLKSTGDGAAPTCTLDASRVRVVAEGGVAAFAIVETFVDHARSSIVVADGVATATPRALVIPLEKAESVVAVRLTIEGATDGLRIEIPRSIFPAPTIDGAQLELRVRSARPGIAHFGEIGDHEIKPTDTGPAGGEGPRGPLAAFAKEIDLGFTPKGDVAAMISPSAAMLDMLRRAMPERVLDLSAENQAGWDDVARRAYAASLHVDPLVAEIGVGFLAWLGGGLDLAVTKIGKAEAPGVAAVPASVVDAIGDLPARARKRYPALSGWLLPLGRSSVLMKAIAADAMHDEARAKAARAAIARLAAVDPSTLTAVIPIAGALVEDRAPVDPPPPVLGGPPSHDSDLDLTVTGNDPGEATRATLVKTKRAHRKLVVRRVLLGAFVLLTLGALVAFLRRER